MDLSVGDADPHHCMVNIFTCLEDILNLAFKLEKVILIKEYLSRLKFDGLLHDNFQIHDNFLIISMFTDLVLVQIATALNDHQLEFILFL